MTRGRRSCAAAPATKPVRSSQCGPTLELTPINSYHGEIAAVQDREDAVVLVNGCTGTLIAAQAGPSSSPRATASGSETACSWRSTTRTSPTATRW